MKDLIKIPIRTKQRNELILITDKLQQIIFEHQINDGILVAQVLHTTAGITINENADPAVVEDLLKHLSKLAPENSNYTHAEGNSDAHIKASLVGSSVTLSVVNQKLVLGTWQGIFFCEFDGPRQREMVVKILVQ